MKMKKRNAILLILSIMIIFSSCTIFKDAFINNFDGAGFYNDIAPRREGDNNLYIDSINITEGFDTIIFMHLKIRYSNMQTVGADEMKGSPELHFGLTDKFINSNPKVKNEVYRRGHLAKWYKYYIRDVWIEQNHIKYFDSFVMLEAKSEMEIATIENLFLRFWGDKWIKVLIDKKFKILPNRISYLGTLTVNLFKTDKYSGKTIHQASPYGTGVAEGYAYDVDMKLEHNESDFKRDFKFIEEKYPAIFNNYKDKFVFFK